MRQTAFHANFDGLSPIRITQQNLFNILVRIDFVFTDETNDITNLESAGFLFDVPFATNNIRRRRHRARNDLIDSHVFGIDQSSFC